MPQKTTIEWTDLASNPIRFRDKRTGELGWHCEKISPGCAHCYSEAIDGRFGLKTAYAKAASADVEPVLNEKELAAITRAKGPKRCFLGDMTDLFLDMIPDAMLDRVFAAMAFNGGGVTFQILTKRPERMGDYVAGLGKDYGRLERAAREMGWCTLRFEGRPLVPWPLPNVWLGVSVEDQQRADERIPALLRVPAKVRFLSAEPLLGPVQLSKDGTVVYCCACGRVAAPADDFPGACSLCGDPRTRDRDYLAGINWVIVGGESGPGARPMDLAWARAMVRQCRAAGVPAFVKQLGAKPYDSDAMKDVPGSCVPMSAAEAKSPRGLRLLGDVLAAGWVGLRDKKGGDMAEWPPDLRVREFPAA